MGLLSTSYESVVVHVAPDRRIFSFIALIVGIATMVFTIAPIARAWRFEPARLLNGGARQTGSLRRARGARMLVAVQVAISLTLLAGSALFVRNLSQLLATDIGFNRENPGPPAAMAESIRAAVRTVDASAPLTIQSVGARIDELLVGERLLTVIAVFLGATSLLLACGALGGLLSHLVTARTREIGLRLALGAERRSVLALAMRQALTVAALGAIAGLGLTLAGGRFVSKFLSTIGPADPWALAAAAAILLLTTAVAGYVPARRAARVDPMVALRAE